MRISLLGALTTRGTSFLAAGVASAVASFLLGERTLLCVGVALIALPVLAAASARRAHYRISSSRIISPPRVPAGHTARVTLRLHNISRVPTGLLLAEDGVPYALGTRPRYVLDKIERNGVRELTYPLRSDLRGKFEIGPLQLRMADSFGLVEVTRLLTGRTTFVVTPRVVRLSKTVISRSWAGEGEGRSRLASAAGEDDVIPRAYRDGDERRRVHWRSTARYGELMVRREEQRWRNRATILLDARASAHMGSGAASSFEAAVSAAASVGVHILQEGLTGQFITESKVVRGGPVFEDALLDELAVIRPSNRRSMTDALKELRASGAGVIIAVMGQLSVAEAQQLAACRSEGSQGIALLFAVSSWADGHRAGQGTRPAAVPSADSTADGTTTTNGAVIYGAPSLTPADDAASRGSTANGGRGRADDEVADLVARVAATGPAQSSAAAAETAAAATALRGAGWHVTTVDASTPLAVAWQRLPRTAEMLVTTAAAASRDSEHGASA